MSKFQNFKNAMKIAKLALTGSATGAQAPDQAQMINTMLSVIPEMLTQENLDNIKLRLLAFAQNIQNNTGARVVMLVELAAGDGDIAFSVHARDSFGNLEPQPLKRFFLSELNRESINNFINAARPQ